MTSPPPVRLINGNKPNEGLPQIEFRGVLGTVCHSFFGSEEEATAICRQLGYSGHDAQASMNRTRLEFGSLEVNVWLDGVYCSDDAARIDLCQHSPLGVRSCTYDLVGIVCDGKYVIYFQ